MRFFLVLTAFALGFLPGTGLAADPVFSPAQRQEIVDILRQALKTDPSILRDAVSALQSDDEAKLAADEKSLIAHNKDTLFAKAGDAVAGNPSGDVSIVEFYDPRCPYCRKMLPGIEAMLKQDRGLRLVYKDIPVLGPPSVMEARAIVAAQMQGGYMKMQTALMNNPAQPSAAMIRQVAKDTGLDADKLLSDMNGAEVTQRIRGNMDLAHVLKVEGTPAFVVGDRLIPGAVDPSQLLAMANETRKNAK
jgi:protein-disulfide isomerase